MYRSTKSRLPVSVLCLIVLLLCATSSVFSQTIAPNTAKIEGTLTDPSSAAVAAATIILQGLSPDTNRREALSSDEGRFRFEVPPGRYRLTITHPALRSYEQELGLTAGETRDLRVQLAIEPLSASVVVTAAAQPIEAAAASNPISIITREEIEQRQAIQLAPLLATLPGFSLAQTGPIGGVVSLFLDGGNSTYTKVLIDGVPRNEPGGAVYDFSSLTLDNIDKVEVAHGAESALAGSDAMTGVIEVLTHRGSTRAPLLVAESEGGSFSTGRGTAQLSGLVGRLDYSGAAAYLQTQGRGVNDWFVNRTLSGNFGLRLTERDSLRLTLRSEASDAGEPGQTVFVPPNLDEHNNIHDVSAGLAWDFSSSAHWQHRAFGYETDIHQLFQNALSDFYLSPDPFGECNFPRSPQAVASAYCDFPFTSRNQYNRAGFQGQSTYLNHRFSTTAGYQYEVENGFLQALNGGHARRNNQAGFVEMRWQAAGRLVLNAGFRAEDNASFGTRGVPRVGAAYILRHGGDLWGATRLRFTYGQGIKEPRLDQSFGTDPCNPGNPDLRPEQSRTVYAGIEQHLIEDKVRVSADYFYNRFRDITSFTFCFPGGPCPVAPPPGCPGGFGTYFNTDLARARGSHVVVEARLARGLSISGNYTYDDTRVLASPNAFDPAQLPGNRLIRRPVHAGNLVLNETWGRFNGNLVGSFVGRRTDSDFLFPPLNLTGNPGYARFDVAATFRFSRKISVIGRVENLLNKNYQDVLGYPSLGRAAYLGMRFRLGGNE